MAGTIDEEVKALIDRAYDHCKQILSDNKEKMEALTEDLLEKESISGDQFRSLMEGRDLGEESATTMFDGFEEKE